MTLCAGGRDHEGQLSSVGELSLITLKAPRRVLSEMAFHEKAGRSQDDSFFILSGKLLLLAFLLRRRVATVAMLPSALLRSDWFRSVHVGRSRFSRCCHLIFALWFCSCRVEPGLGH